MEYMNKDFYETCTSIENFSKIVGEEWNIQPDSIRDYIFASISIGLARNAGIIDEINRLYLTDEMKYNEAAKRSSCINNIIMKQGTLSQELYARKVLGMLLIAEQDYSLRNKIIKLLRKNYSPVYKAVKKVNKNELRTRYLEMDDITRSMEQTLDVVLYLYFTIYCSAGLIDERCIVSIIKDIADYLNKSPMIEDIDMEVKKYSTKIEEIKVLANKEFGRLDSYKDTLANEKKQINVLGGIFKRLFTINKIDINHIFYDSELVDIDKIILAYIRSGYKKFEPEIILQVLVGGVFIQSLIDEYKALRELYMDQDKDALSPKMISMEKELDSIKNENMHLKSEMDLFKQEKIMYKENLNQEVNKLNKSHKAEIVSLQGKIKELENKLLEEKRYRRELNSLREYIFEVKSEYIPHTLGTSLKEHICGKRILIIGGAKSWRRKFREKYPEITTLNGFNESFEISMLNNADCIFFYTGYMNHSTYNRAMNYIRSHQLRFGYIGKTNIDLVEQEIIEELQRCTIRKINLLD